MTLSQGIPRNPRRSGESSSVAFLRLVYLEIRPAFFFQHLVMRELVFLVLNYVHVNGQWLPTLHFAKIMTILAELEFQALCNLIFARVSVSRWYWSVMQSVSSYRVRQRAIQDVLSLSCPLTSASYPPPGGNCVIACPMLAYSKEK